MQRLNRKRLATFIGILAVIALILIYSNFRWQQHASEIQRKKQQLIDDHEVKQKAEQAAAAEHTNYLGRYLNTGYARQPNTTAIALVVVSEGGTINSAVSDALVGRLRTDGVKFLPSYFKTEFISDGLFNTAFNSFSGLSDKLELAKSLDGVLLARESVSYRQNSSEFDNLITADMRLEILIQPVTGQVQNQSWTFTSTGAGMKREDARALAEERIIKQITNNPNMSLEKMP